MPKVKQFKRRLELDASNKWKDTTLFIMYDNNPPRQEPEAGRFWIALPDVMRPPLDKSEVRAKTQAEVERLFDDAVTQYKHLKTERVRIILYDFELAPDPRTDANRYQRDGVSVQIWAGVYDEIISIAGNGDKRYAYNRVDEIDLGFPGSSIPSTNNWMRSDIKQYPHQVPYTAATEQFFLWVRARMGDLVTALAAMEAPAKMLETISAGRLLPLGGAGVNTQDEGDDAKRKE